MELFIFWPLFQDVILPFLLVFVIVFAILAKSRLLGEGKRQIDALVALAIGLMAVAYGNVTGFISNMTGFLAVAAVVILVFLLLLGFFYEPGKFEMKDWVKYSAMVVILIAVIIAVLVFTGGWNYLYNAFTSSEGSSSLIANVIVIIIILAAGAFVWFGSKGK